MKKAKIVSAILTLLIVMPIWYYLLYQILKAINASELLFFLCWVYIPSGILVLIIGKIVGED